RILRRMIRRINNPQQIIQGNLIEHRNLVQRIQRRLILPTLIIPIRTRRQIQGSRNVLLLIPIPHLKIIQTLHENIHTTYILSNHVEESIQAKKSRIRKYNENLYERM